jgi:predicted transcriptional regulator
MNDKDFTKDIRNALKDIGLSDEQSIVYMKLLFSNTPLSVVQLSKATNYGRNKVYRLLNELLKQNLVSETRYQNGSKFTVSNLHTVEMIVKKKKDIYERAESGLSTLTDRIKYIDSAMNMSSNITRYRGIDGLKQVNWNLTHANGIFRVYEVSRLSDYLDQDFAEELRLIWLQKQIYAKDLTNDTAIKAHTNITEYTEKYSEYRHISTDVLKIDTEIYIYNDITTLLQYNTLKYDPASIFCVEIRNKSLSTFNAQMFDILWEQATLLKLVDKHGKRDLATE